MIDFSCPQCQAKLKVKDELAGKRIRCPHCQRVQEVSRPTQENATDLSGSVVHSRAKSHPAEDATLPPASRPAPAADGVTLPPGTSPLSRQTVTFDVPGDEPADGDTREVVKGAFSYEVEGEIARGGMGAIMRAVDQDIRREVAVKFLLNHADERQKTRFIEEAQITGQLEHPNIVPIHQFGVHGDGRCFFSMKMVKGRSLADILKDQCEPGALATGGEFTLGRLLNIFSNICNALAYAHSRKVIHRDLKPANIMVGDFGEVYVMDWGLGKVLGKESEGDSRKPKDGKQRSEETITRSASRKASRVATSRAMDSNLTQAGAIMGTPAYMPPEQATGEAVDERSDIYSLGAILYEILTLSPPVGRGGDMVAILMRVADGDIKPPEKQAPERSRQGLIPPELSAVALKALAKDPADRYQTVEALQHDIQLFLEGRSVSAKRDTAWELLKKLVKRNKGVSLATAAALVVLAAVAGFFLKINYDARVEAEDKNALYETEKELKRKEQEAKLKNQRHSAPAFVDAAKLLTDKKQFTSALTQVNTALEYDKDLTEAYLLKGQLLMGLERYSEAAQPLAEYLRRKPGDTQASKLAELAARPEPDKGPFFVTLYEVFREHKALALAGHMTHLADRFLGPLREKLPNYRKRIEAKWAGYGSRLILNAKGELVLSLAGTQPVLDVTPLKGMPLSSLALTGTQVQDLEPLHGMPLHTLTMDGCPVRDLGPLKGMGLRHLGLRGCSQITDLEPLADMPLKQLEMRGCVNIKSLKPLRGMSLVRLDFPDSGVESFEGLEGLKNLKVLMAWGGAMGRIKDLCPLRGLPLQQLAFNAVNMRDFEPLRGMKLTDLSMSIIRVQHLDFLKGMPLESLAMTEGEVKDLAALGGMKLTNLNLRNLRGVRDLAVLKGMKLIDLDVGGCRELRDIQVLKGMPLKNLNLHACQVRDLGPLKGMTTLEVLAILECPEIRELAPLHGLQLKTIYLTPRLIPKENMESLRRMKTLETVGVGENRNFAAAEFWTLYDKGQFKK